MINEVIHVYKVHCEASILTKYKYFRRQTDHQNSKRFEEKQENQLEELARELASSQYAAISVYEQPHPSRQILFESTKISFEPPYSVEFDEHGNTVNCKELSPENRQEFLSEFVRACKNMTRLL